MKTERKPLLGVAVLASVLALTSAACVDSEAARGSSGQDDSTIAGDQVGSDTVGSLGHQTADHAKITCWAADPANGSQGITFADITEDAGLVEPLLGMFGHAAAWGDIDGDGTPDLAAGTFADRPTERYHHRGATAAAPDRLLIAQDGGFVHDEHFPSRFGRTSGAVFADLDNDSDLDLVLSRNVKEDQPDMAATEVYENEEGQLSQVDGGIDPQLGGRSVAVLDYDGDDRLDLFIVEDKHRGGSSRLYRNLGGLRFEDATAEAQLPFDLQGLGVATSDVDADGDVDIFVAGDNVLLLDAGDTFGGAPSAVFDWPPIGTEDDPAGAAFGDVDRDGRPDLVIGQHFNSTLDFDTPAPVRLFLNRTEPGGTAVFEEVTRAAGLVPLPTKAPHVEILDFDNDGWPDILTSASAAGGSRPAVFRGLGIESGVPRFATPAGLGDPQYWVTGPAADLDRDGRLDVFLVEFEPSLPSVLLRNESASGNWLAVSVDPGLGGGVGARVRAYEAGGLGDASRLLGSSDITASRGYGAGVETMAHLGLGEVDEVDIEVSLSDGAALTAAGVGANRHVRLPDGCASP